MLENHQVTRKEIAEELDISGDQVSWILVIFWVDTDPNFKTGLFGNASKEENKTKRKDMPKGAKNQGGAYSFLFGIRL